MKRFLRPNIDGRGRVMRGAITLVFVISAIWSLSYSRWLALLLFVSAGFTAFEALRGWCVLRACGIKTKM